jgi:hypothetical protein
LNVDYYTAPEIDYRAFADAASALKKLRTYTLDPFEQGRQFRDSLSFAFYCVALALIKNLPPEHLPAKTFGELNSMFTRTAQTRNPSGHSVVINKPTMRGNYFECITMWRECLQRVAVSRDSQRNEGLLQPLPIVEPSGVVLW